MENRDKFCIKLSGLARNATEADISNYLSGCNVKQIEIVMTVNEKGRPSGDAFVKIDSEDNLKESLLLNETAMGNRKIEISQKTGEDFEEAKCKLGV